MSATSPRSKCKPRKPHFFKVLLGDFKQRLRIPPMFVKHISKQSRKVILQGPNGSRWQVELSKNIKGTFLSAGWPNFVQDHSLKEHEFLVFRYDGNMLFSVLIFDTTACERKDVFEIKSCKKSALYEGKNRRGSLAKHPLNFNCILQHQSSRSVLPKLLADAKYSPKELSERRISSPKFTRKTKIKTKDDESPISVIRPYHYCQTIYSSRRRSVTTEERLKAQEAADSFSSVFPYTVIRMGMTRVYKSFTMRFPIGFSRVHLPRKRTSMVLRDPTGKAWVVIYIPAQGERDRLSGGWTAFARGNNLEEGDFCAFELVGPVEFHVHIFRVVEETTPLVRISTKVY